jgi:protein-disulfide isomerase
MTELREGPTLSPPVAEDRDHIQGPSTAAVTLVEYGDYECPYCGAAYPVLNDLMAAFPDDLRFVFRNFPMTQMHPHAQRAAEAAEAAGAQQKFWAMHDILYENQDALAEPDLLAYAADLGLDTARFQAELADGTYRARVRDDFSSGVRSGVNGTPTFFINGRRHNGPFDLATLERAVESAME